MICYTLIRDTLKHCKTLRFYEFFAGAGLVHAALKDTWDCLWANDSDPDKEVVYRRNFPDTPFLRDDVGKVTPNDLPRAADMAWASFPCQDLSLAGWQRGMSARRSGTFWPFWQLMAALRESGDLPRIIAIENVKGLLYGSNFSGLAEALVALGMQFGALVVDARHFVPQSRPRVFVIGVDARLNTEGFVDHEPTGKSWYPRAVLSAYGNLEPEVKAFWRWWKLPAPAALGPTISEIIDKDSPNVEWNNDAETSRLLDLMSDRNLAKVSLEIKSRKSQVGFLYKRTRGGHQRAEVRFDGFAGCLRTPTGGSSRQTILIINRGAVRSRLLSPREAAKLMGAPDFWLPENYNQAYRAMGDAVVVPVVAHLAHHLLTPMAQAAQTLPRLGPLSGSTQLDHLYARTSTRASTWLRQRLGRGIEAIK
jgi:DNA (cytosine-5)-methyltransferase 1